jgi:hypothetical protein
MPRLPKTAIRRPYRRRIPERPPWPPAPHRSPAFNLFDILDATLSEEDRNAPPPIDAGDPLADPPDAEPELPEPAIPPLPEPDLPPDAEPTAHEIDRTLSTIPGLADAPYRIAEYRDADLATIMVQEDYIAALAGHMGVRESLAASDNPRARAFLAEMLSCKPRDLKKPISLALLARKHGIGPLELTEIWRDHSVRETVLRMAVGAPKVADHVVEDALSTRSVCTRCDGSGEVEVKRRGQIVPDVCPQCEGRGWTRKEGSPHARDLMMKSIGVLKQGPGIVVSIDQRQSGGESVIERLERADRESGGGGGNAVDAGD